MRSWILEETNYHHTKDHPYRVAVLPLGATEPHNLHLPYGTDTFQVTMVGQRICEAAHQQGAHVLLLPTIPYGTETNMRELPFAMNVNPSTLYGFITDLMESLVGSGIRRILLLNGHGGNELKPLLRELSGKLDAYLFLCNWYQVISDRYAEIFERAEDHAGEMETSLALAYFPHLVRLDQHGKLAADDGQIAESRFTAVTEGWVSITRSWHLLTTNTGAGNPHAATADKGERAMELLVQRLSQFLVQLSQELIDDRFPFAPD